MQWDAMSKYMFCHKLSRQRASAVSCTLSDQGLRLWASVSAAHRGVTLCEVAETLLHVALEHRVLAHKSVGPTAT